METPLNSNYCCCSTTRTATTSVTDCIVLLYYCLSPTTVVVTHLIYQFTTVLAHHQINVSYQALIRTTERSTANKTYDSSIDTNNTIGSYVSGPGLHSLNIKLSSLYASPRRRPLCIALHNASPGPGAYYIHTLRGSQQGWPYDMVIPRLGTLHKTMPWTYICNDGTITRDTKPAADAGCGDADTKHKADKVRRHNCYCLLVLSPRV